MTTKELKEILASGGMDKYSDLYQNTNAQAQRVLLALDGFVKLYGEGDVMLLSVPGRSEILGNHTDHNYGCVLAGAIDRDVMALARRTDTDTVRFYSEGYGEVLVSLNEVNDPDKFEKYSSASLIAGVIRAFMNDGLSVGGFDVYSNTEVLKGSGISSSAAFEVMIGNILNHLYNGGSVDNKKLAMYAQYAENVYFGKPCGLMDQMACAVGGFVYIDFENPKAPIVEPINFSLTDAGYSLVLVNTGDDHADLSDEYAAVPLEMKAVAKALGRDVLRGIGESELVRNLGALRAATSDRAVLRAIHFVRENDRVNLAKSQLISGETDGLLKTVLASGHSSFEYLQNVFTPKMKNQGLSLALAMAGGFGDGIGAYRVHGGGFAGTILTFVKNEAAEGFIKYMDGAFGAGASMKLRIRGVGAAKLFG